MRIKTDPALARKEWIKKYSGVTADSRCVEKGNVFFAIDGAKLDGRDFISEAIKKGACAIVTGKNFKHKIDNAELIRVDNPRIELARAAKYFYDNPSGRINVIGITGTKGKTTISYLLASILKKAGFETGVIGTIAHSWKDKIREAKNTTPGAIELQKLLNDMVADSVKYCTMEVSSHALDQDRVLGIDFKTAIFTNISGEHMDYHRTFENYLEAKSRLFINLNPSNLAVVNSDDKNSGNISRLTRAKIIKYGLSKNADVRAEGIKIGPDKTGFKVITRTDSFEIRSRLIGIFNVYNTLAAVSAALGEGISPEVIKGAIADFGGVEGRMELVSPGPIAPKIKIFVDYAHTDEALKNALETLRIMAKGRLITVFGCGGNRDRQKRPRMGNVASKLSDFVIITSDNPRDEEPLSIAREIEKGLDKNFKKYKIVVDRFEAIKEAVNMAMPGDIIIIAGKGHEKYQIIGNRILPFSDREVVRMALSSVKCQV